MKDTNHSSDENVDELLPEKPALYQIAQEQSRLLQLPPEILDQVIQTLIDSDGKEALGKFALVSQICRTMARPAQFADMRFDFSPRAHNLLNCLIETSGSLEAPEDSVGTFIRRVTVVADRYWVARAQREIHDSIWDGKSTREVQQELLNKIRELNKQREADYEILLDTAIRNGMPNLEAVVRKDDYSLGEHFFEAVIRSSAKHLVLERSSIDTPLIIKIPDCMEQWSLRSLRLGVRLSLTKSIPTTHNREEHIGHRERNEFNESLLKLCSTTLESLTWTDSGSYDRDYSFQGQPLSFSRLKRFRSRYIEMPRNTLSSILSAPLRELELGNIFRGDWKIYGPEFRNCNLEYLHTFVFRTIDSENVEDVAAFISKHPHLHKLCLDESEAIQLAVHVVSLLPTFYNLTSLSLHFDEILPDASLATIGSLSTLEHLRVSVGSDRSSRSNWIVNHDSMREQLRNLPNLRRLAICRDTYRVDGLEENRAFDYYSKMSGHIDGGRWLRQRPDLDKRLGIFEHSGFKVRRGAEKPADADDYDFLDWSVKWELSHRNFTLTEVEEYAFVMPKLEWMYCGQLRVHVQFPEEDVLGNAIPLSTGRDACSALLNRMFALGEYDE